MRYATPKLDWPFAAVAAVAVLAVGGEAQPCMNPVRLNNDEAVKLVASAEKALEAGHAKKAAGILDPDVRFAPWSPTGTYGMEKALARRARLVMASAVIREASLKSKLDHALAVLDALRAESPDVPAIEARWAESRAAKGTDAGRSEAAKVLEGLAARDLVPDAEAWALLSALRAKAGAAAGAAAAAERCRALAKRKGVCPEAPKGAAPKAKPGATS